MDSKPGQGALPVSERHRSFLADVYQGQIEKLQQRIVAWKRSTVLSDLAQAHVRRLNGVAA